MKLWQLYIVLGLLAGLAGLGWWLRWDAVRDYKQKLETAAAQHKAKENELIGELTAARALWEADNARFNAELAKIRAGGACRPVDPDLRRLLDAGSR